MPASGAAASYGDLLLTSLVVLGVVCVAAFVLVRLVGRFLATGRVRGAHLLDVVARVPLEPRRSLYVVEVAGKTLLVGTSEMGLSVLSELDGSEVRARVVERPSFGELVRAAWSRRRGLRGGGAAAEDSGGTAAAAGEAAGDGAMGGGADDRGAAADVARGRSVAESQRGSAARGAAAAGSGAAAAGSGAAAGGSGSAAAGNGSAAAGSGSAAAGSGPAATGDGATAEHVDEPGGKVP